uniref:Uncharacterized protein n=1 Tax=Anguilla anguilla TaxID=7936 RepID=A0A0E9RHK6_ANGAN
MQVIRRPRFNNIEIRLRFNFASLYDVDNYAESYVRV